MDPLLDAENYLSATAPAHARALAHVAALGARVSELSAARNDADAALEAKRRSSAAALRDVKLVAARMVQEREASIIGLKRQLADVSRALAEQQ